jgi:hypothetical protein
MVIANIEHDFHAALLQALGKDNIPAVVGLGKNHGPIRGFMPLLIKLDGVVLGAQLAQRAQTTYANAADSRFVVLWLPCDFSFIIQYLRVGYTYALGGIQGYAQFTYAPSKCNIPHARRRLASNFAAFH